MVPSLLRHAAREVRASCATAVLPNEDGVGAIKEKVERDPLLSYRIDARADLARGKVGDPLGSIA